MTTAEANDVALLLRAGSAGRTDGDHRGAHDRPAARRREHRDRGFNATLWGFVAIACS
jgi:hypothetical protein